MIRHKICRFIMTRPSVEILLHIKETVFKRDTTEHYKPLGHHFVVVKMAGNQPVAYWRGSGYGTNHRWSKHLDLAHQYTTEYQAKLDTNRCDLSHDYNYRIQLVHI